MINKPIFLKYTINSMQNIDLQLTIPNQLNLDRLLQTTENCILITEQN
jgi:hypothetical protein